MSAQASTTLENAYHPRLLSSPVILLLQALVSAAGLVVEIIAGRMLAPYVGMSVYSWTAVIAVVLAGFSVGHWIGGVFAERPRQHSLGMIAMALGLAATTTAMTIPILRLASGPILSSTPDAGLAILALASIIVFLPSFFAGIPSPVLAKTIVDLRPAGPGKALGAIFAAGSIGAIIGTLAAGFLFISWLGSTLTLSMIALTYVISAIVLLFMGGTLKHRIVVVISIGITLIITAYNLSLGTVCTRESQYYCIRIVDFTPELGTSAKLMVLDHLGHGINLEDYPEELITPYVALIDLYVQNRFGGVPASSFFIGGGAYTLPRAWKAASPDATITVGEIDPEVTKLAQDQMWLSGTGINILHGDARVTLRQVQKRYHTIIGDAFTDIAAPPHLVTYEFFHLIKARLKNGGLYAMNVVDHVPNLPALLAIHRTQEAVFNHVEVFAEEGDFLSGGRTTFVLFASDEPSGHDHLVDQNGQVYA
ncbi:MAG: fused MFS/spermidine synthase [Pseudomonadota bacterium]